MRESSVLYNCTSCNFHINLLNISFVLFSFGRKIFFSSILFSHMKLSNFHITCVRAVRKMRRGQNSNYLTNWFVYSCIPSQIKQYLLNGNLICKYLWYKWSNTPLYSIIVSQIRTICVCVYLMSGLSTREKKMKQNKKKKNKKNNKSKKQQKY